ncbi:MAG: serine/threonine-protein kinase, partial [Planctomycetota bacterium]
MSPTDDAVPWEPAIARYLDAGGELAGDAFERWLQEQPEFDLSDEEVERAAAIVEMCAELDALGGLDSVRTRSASGAREFGNEPKVRAASRGASIGPYVLKRFIARGGMGEVWEAEEVELGRRVALKLVLPERIDARALDMFAREAKAGSRVQHPGIVTTLAYGRGDELSWIAQELVPGSSTLKGVIDELRSEEIVPRDHYRRVAEIVAEIASALQAAHDVGVVHRDVKPSNVLMTPDGRPKVVDFGLARVVDDSFLSLTGEIAGTWAYMSPEQVKAKRIGLDHRTDIFSLGVVLYELLTLRRPFEGDTTHQIAERIVAYDPVDATKVRSQCPRDLAVIAGKCLEKDRERRYTTMSDVAADLRRHLGQEPIVARPPGRIRKLELWARRNPAKSLAGAIAAAAFIAISLLLAENVRARRDLASEVESVKRLSALQDYDDLVALADTLWPPHPANVDAYETWIDEAARLVAELPVHRAKREELGRIAGAGGAFPQTPAGGDARWWSANLDKLIASLESLTDETTGLLSSSPSAVSIEHGWSVPRRLAFATSIRDGLARGASFSDRWSEAIASIAADPTYGGLELAAQPGLVPIGRDPASGLWEFWHVATGDEPRRNESGALEPTAASGIVLVLIPSGTFWMGSTRDVDAPR